MEQHKGLPESYVAYMDALERLAAARSDLARRVQLQQAIEAERDQIVGLRLQLAREQEDVDALESFGLRSILARIRGRLDEELTAEQAEVEAVRLEVAVRYQALAELEAAAGGVGVLDCEGWVRECERSVESARERWEAEHRAGGSSTGRRLIELDDGHAYLVARSKEVGEARQAAAEVILALVAAHRKLDSAFGWSTFDILGGGLLASANKFDCIDGAATAIGRAQRALLRLDAELADLRQPTVSSVDLPSPALRAIDLWLDNPFTNLMVNGQILASVASVERSLASVRETAAGLDAHHRQIRAELELIDRARESLLLEPPAES